MKKTILNTLILALAFNFCAAAAPETIKLDAPNLERAGTLMQALKNRKSDKKYSPKPLSTADLSDLLWAANGVNRSENGKRTAPSAKNRKDINIYVCLADGAYLYDAEKSVLNLVSKDDLRWQGATVTLVLVSDFNDRWSPLDAGIVSQNIALFCAAAGIGTYPHTSMDMEKLRKSLNLKEPQTPMLCNSVGYLK